MLEGPYVGKFGDCGCCRGRKGVGHSPKEEEDGQGWGYHFVVTGFAVFKSKGGKSNVT